MSVFIQHGSAAASHTRSHPVFALYLLSDPKMLGVLSQSLEYPKPVNTKEPTPLPLSRPCTCFSTTCQPSPASRTYFVTSANHGKNGQHLLSTYSVPGTIQSTLCINSESNSQPPKEFAVGREIYSDPESHMVSNPYF